MLQRPRPQHGPDTTWQTDPWGCRQLEDKIELVFLSVRGDLKTRPEIDIHNYFFGFHDFMILQFMKSLLKFSTEIIIFQEVKLTHFL